MITAKLLEKKIKAYEEHMKLIFSDYDKEFYRGRIEELNELLKTMEEK